MIYDCRTWLPASEDVEFEQGAVSPRLGCQGSRDPFGDSLLCCRFWGFEGDGMISTSSGVAVAAASLACLPRIGCSLPAQESAIHSRG